MKVGFIFYPKALMTGVSLSAEMLRCGAQLRSRKQQADDKLEIQLLSVTNDDVVDTVSGIKLQSDGYFAHSSPLDLLIIPPMWGNPLPVINRYPELVPWLLKQHKGGAKLVGTGTGVCWLAETGLLNGGVATTHWYFLDKFKQRYPQVKLNKQATITESNNIYCTASINSQTEMVVYLIKRLFGDDIASVIERHFSHEVSSSSAQPFYQLGGDVQFDEAIAMVLDFIESDLSRRVSNQDMADYCGLSLRTFNRKFKGQVGKSPTAYVLQRRMDEAKRLLADISLTASEVANLVGFQDPAHFSKTFLKHFSLTPSAYRKIAKAKVYHP